MAQTSTVTTKGQVLIPGPIRKKLNIKPFDRLTFDIVNNKVFAYKLPSIDEMQGSVKSKIKLTDKQLEDAIDSYDYS